MLASAFSSAVANLFVALLVLAALAIYVTLARQIIARRSTIDTAVVAPRTFGLPEAFLVAALIWLLLMNVIGSMRPHEPIQLNGRALIGDFSLRLFFILLVAAILKFRGVDINLAAGFSRISFKRAMSTGIILLLAAWPLIAVADGISQAILGGGSSKQEIVDLFNRSGTIGQRVAIIVVAVVVAPASEEFIFRFFIYGVLRRYFGVAVGVIFSALLFAAAHTHLPSAAPLFVLGGCFALAYEWSGSILVSMAMHALFNSAQLVLLAFPELVQQ